jgi:lipopolysaccharide/colanic/teichoic acid biosynthesis glycosyltransferase
VSPPPTAAPPARRTPRRPALPPAGWYQPCKRAADLTAALALLLLTAPLVLLAMLLIKLTSRGPVLYTQTRLGRHGRPFAIYKLRTMAHRAESLTGPCWSRPGDPRVTRLGRFLRRTHLDELPQRWNVLRGDMSLVGPRPERPEFVPQLEQAVAHYRERLRVRPGVTGLAQVQLPPDTDLDSVRLKLAYDLYPESLRSSQPLRRQFAATFTGFPRRRRGEKGTPDGTRPQAGQGVVFPRSPRSDGGDPGIARNVFS